MLELDDIQGGVLRPRPSPYAAMYLLLRLDDPAGGRKLMGRLADLVPSAAATEPPDTWVGAALTYQGLVALGLPPDVLASFPWEFRQGMAARARALGDTGASAPEYWERPLGTPEVHVVLTVLAPDAAGRESAYRRVQAALEGLRGIALIWRQDCHALASGTEPFGFKDGIGHPAVEGSGIPGSNPAEAPLKAGEFVLGYPDETGAPPPMPLPEVLGRNGTFVAFRKLKQDVAGFRRYLRANAGDAGAEELLAAKLMGRWRSGAPLARCPFQDDAALGADPRRNNAFTYADDATGYKTPPGSHIRRTNPRDAAVAGLVRLHRMIRRGTAYGPELPAGVLDDDGADRGLMFAFVGTHLDRQFEFVQAEWIGGGEFLDLGTAQDPIAGNPAAGRFTVPARPLARRLVGLPAFVTTRGGEYAFMPGLRALRWLAGQAAGRSSARQP